jgi:NhaA family Na+:H+ antiporter
LPGLVPLSRTFTAFLESEKAGGALLIAATVVSLALANSPLANGYSAMWDTNITGMSVRHWVHDGVMALFFLLVGLELERELYSGELADFRSALLPIAAAAGGVVLPAAMHFALNAGTATQGGVAIPMATDIAFALGVLALLGSRVPPSLKVFIAALAVMDDLAAIVVIALFYTAQLDIAYLAGALAVLGVLVALNVVFRVMALAPYLIGGALLWWCMLQSGVHATLAGVLLAFAIPYSSTRDDERSPSHRLEHLLHKPVAFIVLPLFALSATDITVAAGSVGSLVTTNGLGIIAGLVVGKPLGIVAASWLAVKAGLSRLPEDLGWRHVLGAGFLGGIGFTMSIFIANLAFEEDVLLIEASILAVLAGSLVSALAGYLWLRR